MRLKRTTALILSFCACLTSIPAFGQEKDPRSSIERLEYFLPASLAAVEQTAKERALATNTQTFSDFKEQVEDPLNTALFAFVFFALPPSAADKDFKEFLRSAAKSRLDEQIGSSSSTGGSTSLASRPGLTSLVSMALEAGAVSQTIDQNVMTLRSNADGLLRFLSNQEVFSSCGGSKKESCSFLKDIELSASFNVSQSGSQTLSGTSVSGTGLVDFSTALTKKQFSSATVRWAAKNDRDLRSPKYRENWLKWFRTNQAALQAAGKELSDYVLAVLTKANTEKAKNAAGEPLESTVYGKWRDETEIQPGPDAAEEAAARLEVLVDELKDLDPEFEKKLDELSIALVRYFALQRDLESTIVTDSVMTAEFTYSEPVLQPKLFTGKLSFAFSPQSGGTRNPGTVTLNFGMDWFKEPQPKGDTLNTSRWKDVQVALQFDRPLGPPDSALRLSVGTYYQYQINPGIISIPENATMLPGTTIPIPPTGTKLLAERGNIFVAQAALVIQKPGGGLKVPIGISWSNRTELATGNEVRGHIGFTFDSSPLALLTGLR